MSKPVKWINLKLDSLPSIAQEVERVSKEYEQLSDDIRKRDKQAYDQLILLQASIRGRIEEFDRFYDRNYADYRIGYFEKMKLKLRKLLNPHVDVNRLIYEDGMQFQNKGNPKQQPKSVSPISKQIPIKQQPIIQQESVFKSQIIKQQPQQTQQPQQPQQIRPKTSLPNSKPYSKVVKQTPKVVPKKQEEQKEDLVFTIKMTKEEYLQYLQARTNKQKKH